VDAEQRDRKLAQLDHLAREAESAARHHPSPDTLELAERVALTRSMVWRTAAAQDAPPPAEDDGHPQRAPRW
jgi:hypothetical protein